MDITLRHISKSYNKHQPVLESISFGVGPQGTGLHCGTVRGG